MVLSSSIIQERLSSWVPLLSWSVMSAGVEAMSPMSRSVMLQDVQCSRVGNSTTLHTNHCTAQY